MRPQLAAIAAQQDGLFTRRQAIDAGYTEREMKTLTGHGGGWLVVRRGVYAERSLCALDDDARYRQRVKAAHLNRRHDAVASHQSSAALHRMPLRPTWRDLVHFTREGVRGGRTEAGVKHHPATYEESQVVVVDGVPSLDLARTAVDIGRESGFENGVIACDAALRLGTTEARLAAALEPMWCWPGVTAARAAVAVADGGAETIGESLARLLVHELEIGVPETQVPITDGSRTAIVDMRVGRHLFEFDGRVKYVGRERGGVADRPVEEILWQEKKREDWLRSLGHGVSRITWAELFGELRRRTRHRLAREFAQTVARYGAAA